MVRGGAQQGGLKVNYNWITEAEVRLEIQRTEEVRAFVDDAVSITISAAAYDEKGLKRKVKLDLTRAEIDEAVASVLSHRVDTLGVMLRKIEKKNEFLALVKEASLAINPATAEVTWSVGNAFDPYRITDADDVPPFFRQLYWARSPGSDIWVEAHDLPDETREVLLRLAKEKQRVELEDNRPRRLPWMDSGLRARFGLESA
jgi:hypothetical protein